MDTGAWPDRRGRLCGRRRPSLGAPALARLHSGRLEGAPTARPSGRVHDLVAADAPAAAPEAAPGRTEISAASAPRPAVPAPAATARDRRHIGWRHRHCAHRSKRLRIMGCQRDHQPDAGGRKQNRRPHGLSPLAFDAARREKSVFGRERQSDRAPQGSSFTIRSRPASGVASRKAPARRARSRVSNFEQTGEAGAGNCRTDGRVAQSAERVREQHETVVRNHSPAAIPPRKRTATHPGARPERK